MFGIGSGFVSYRSPSWTDYVYLLNYITDVRDIDGKLLPYGVIGELYIGGVGVSKGYYNMKDKTMKIYKIIIIALVVLLIGELIYFGIRMYNNRKESMFYEDE